MGLVIVFYYLSVSSIAERSICWIFTIAQLVVSALWYVELNWPASCDTCIARSIASWVVQGESTCAPVVHFSFVQVGIVWEITCIVSSCTCDKRNTWGSIFSFSIANWLGNRHCFILWEISDIIRLGLSFLCWWF